MFSLTPMDTNTTNKIRIGAVSYLNTKPLLYGIKNNPIINEIELIEAYPSLLASMLLNDEIDMGLVPVAILPKMKESYIYTDFCIGAEGAVASVCLFSEVPIEAIETIVLDYQSKTSVNLLLVLLKEYWQLNPRIVYANSDDYQQDIIGTTAAVVIGDRAFVQKNISTYSYDLAACWKDFTGLPFVFAAWIARRPLPKDFIDAFNNANDEGLQNIDKVISENEYPHYDLLKYYTENISYDLSVNKRKGLSLFLEKLSTL